VEVGPPVDRKELGRAPRELVAAVRLHGLQDSDAHPQPEGQEMGPREGGPGNGSEAQEEDLQGVGVLGGQPEGGGVSADAGSLKCSIFLFVPDTPFQQRRAVLQSSNLLFVPDKRA
jgi:hypothetical protein